VAHRTGLNATSAKLAMAAVYLAEDWKQSRNVAVEALKPELAAAGAVLRIGG
jgi:hypothetical protein